ncbi:unnamed protein product, partial [Coccothraustes coccothraustes]
AKPALDEVMEAGSEMSWGRYREGGKERRKDGEKRRIGASLSLPASPQDRPVLGLRAGDAESPGRAGAPGLLVLRARPVPWLRGCWFRGPSRCQGSGAAATEGPAGAGAPGLLLPALLFLLCSAPPLLRAPAQPPPPATRFIYAA